MSTNSQTNTIKSKAEHRRYGFLSILALVIGSVIGSGIFFKNDSVNATTQSGFVSLLGWLVISAVVLMIATASLELFSSKKAHKRAGLSGLTNTFIGPRAGKFVGMFFVYAYFPASLAAVAVYAGSLGMDAISGATGFQFEASNSGAWTELAITTAIGMGLLGMVGVVNTLTEKPGKIFQTFGTGFQLLPLSLVLFLVIFLISAPNLFQPATGNGLEGAVGQPGWEYGLPVGSGRQILFDLDSTVNGGLMVTSEGLQEYGLEEGGGAVFGTLLLALPPIMFTFDGFLFASSLQTEAKSKRTYPVALIVGLIVITIVYLAVAIGTVMTATVPPTFSLQQVIDGGIQIASDGKAYDIDSLGSWGHGDFPNADLNTQVVMEQHQDWWQMGGVAGLVGRLFPQVSEWLPQTVSFIIVISTLTTVQGFFITGSRELANLAHADVIADTNGFYLRRNKAGVPQNSAWTLFIMSFIWLAVAKGLDAIMLADQLQGWTEYGQSVQGTGEYNLTIATDFTSNFVVIVAFVMYVLPIVGGMINRFTQKIGDVEKSKLFWVTAVPSVLMVALLTVTNVLSTFAIDFSYNPLEVLNIVLLLVTLGVPIYFSIKSGRKVMRTSSSEWERKEFFKAAYEALQTPEEYEATELSVRAGHTQEIKLEKALEKKIMLEQKNKELEINNISNEPKKNKLENRATLRKKNIKELREQAKGLGEKGYSSLRKEELVDLVFNALRK